MDLRRRMTRRSVRQVARVVLLDPTDKILLVKYEDAQPMDPTRTGSFVYWVPPGGELQDGEGYQDAARRELHEETGLSVEIGAWLWKRSIRLQQHGEWIDQEERYYLAHVGIEEPPAANLSPEDIAELRWWSIPELKGASEVLFPDGLVDLLPPIVGGKIPREPVDV